MRLAQDLRSQKVYITNKLPRLKAHLMKHKTKSILRPRTTSEDRKWMILKREHPCLLLFPLEIMFANTISSRYLCFRAREICANFGGAEEESICKSEERMAK